MFSSMLQLLTSRKSHIILQQQQQQQQRYALCTTGKLCSLVQHYLQLWLCLQAAAVFMQMSAVFVMHWSNIQHN
jgi:hypothetical protein